MNTINKYIKIDTIGLDEKIESLSKRKRNIHAINVYQHGETIFSKTYNNYDKNETHQVYSCTKSIISTLIGIAIHKGFIESVNTKLVDLLNGYEEYFFNGKEKLTLKHALTMTTGLEWNEFDSFSHTEGVWKGFLTSDDPLGYVLSRPLIEEPGAVYNYNSGVSHILSIVIEKHTGMSTIEFAKEYFFTPLDIDILDLKWKEDNNGIVFGGHGLHMKIEDLQKLGVLFLNKGKYKGNQIVSESWVNESTYKHSINTRGYSGYGYQWWIGKVGEHDFYGAFGHAGQRVYVFKKLDLVITFLCRMKPEFGIQERLIKKFIIHHKEKDNDL